MLKGKKVNLRTIRTRDLDAYLDLASDIESRGPHYPLGLETETSLRHRFEKDGFWSSDSGILLVVDPVTDRILGMVVYFKAIHYYHALEIGYIVFNPKDRGKGFMEEALRMFSQYLFDHFPISRLQVLVEPGNIGSRRVAEKCGYQFEGTARHVFISRGVPCDINVFSLVRPDLEP
jgi:ribosomal-protein-alanine N-acetyltransferase